VLPVRAQTDHPKEPGPALASQGLRERALVPGRTDRSMALGPARQASALESQGPVLALVQTREPAQRDRLRELEQASAQQERARV
jgi:hypothetical protein